MRIISLVPSATEIICALGQEDKLIGRSHECDYPKTVKKLPSCTNLKLDISGSSYDIDKSINSYLNDSNSIYKINKELIKQLRPDIIFTQSQCDVCAVSSEEVEALFSEKSETNPVIIPLHPKNLGDIWKDIFLISENMNISKKGKALQRKIIQDIRLLQSSVKNIKDVPSIACIEWIDPLMFAGNWVPEMVEIAGGKDLFGIPGAHSSWDKFDNLLIKDPEIIILMPCGFSIEKTQKEMDALKETTTWTKLQAFKNKNIFIVDGNQYFNRPGPRILDSIKILIEIISGQNFFFGYKEKAWEKLNF